MEESGTKLHIPLVLKYFVLFPQKLSVCGRVFYICDRNGERSLAIQNNVPQSTPLISKSLPVRITPNGNLLLLSQIARNLKNDSENLFSW